MVEIRKHESTCVSKPDLEASLGSHKWPPDIQLLPNSLLDLVIAGLLRDGLLHHRECQRFDGSHAAHLRVHLMVTDLRQMDFVRQTQAAPSRHFSGPAIDR